MPYLHNTEMLNQVSRINLAETLIDLNIDSSVPALVWKNKTFSRTQVIEAIRRIARFYASLNFPDRARVILHIPDSPAFFVHFLGVILANLVPVPLSINMTSHEVCIVLDDAKPAAFVTSSDSIKFALEETNIGEDCSLIQVNLGLNNLPHLEQLTHKPVSEMVYEGCAFMQYSSGSTGMPKAVMHSHISPLEACRSYARDTLGITKEDRVFSAAKMSFGYGLGNSLLFPFQIDATSILTEERCTFETIQSVLKLHRPTIFFGVPSLYVRLLDTTDEGSKLDTSSLRLCVSAGEPLPSAIQEKWYDKFRLPIIDGLGSTELLHVVISNTPNDITYGSIGRPVPGCKARVVDSSGREITSNKQGLLEVSAPFRMLGYWPKQADVLKASDHEWVCTGDICKKDDDDRFWFCCRSNEIFKVKGLWVSPVEIEGILMKSDLVVDALVSGKKNEKGLTEIVATIVATKWSNTNNIKASLIAFLKEYLSPHKLPKKFLFVQKLPTTSTGKKKRTLIADAVEI